MKIVYEGASAELVEKKSKFIANVAPVRTEEEATAFIAETKKKYWDCRHNCSAFVIGGKSPVTRCSDDGEPAGTAGRPILEVIQGMGISDVCVVVSRYFGGVLLGTGGLVRAYSGAAKLGLEASTVIEKQMGCELEVTASYNLVGKIQFNMNELAIPEISNEYGENVKLSYIVPEKEVSQATARLTEVTSGKAIFNISDPVSYAIVKGEVLFL